jgi:hypothetical protein
MPKAQDRKSTSKDELRSLRGAVGRCTPPPSRKQDRWFVIRYDGRSATLVVGPEHHGSVRAQVFSCDGTTLLRDSTVSLP